MNLPLLQCDDAPLIRRAEPGCCSILIAVRKRFHPFESAHLN